jgi:uncharacterized protein (TIGR03118 family)
MRLSGVFLGAAAVAAVTALGAAPASAQFYEQHNLVSSDGDADLINSWGLTSGPTTPWWVADNGTNQSTLYDKDGVKQQRIVQVPGKPTGAVFNITASGFQLTPTNNTLGKTGKSVFLFATESGTILAWNDTGGPANTNTAAVVKTTPNAIYKGLAIASLDSTHARIYATDFHQGRVDVFDETFTQINNVNAFVDPTIPDGYAPFGIQAIGRTIFVTYGLQDEDAEDDVGGPGHGFVDAYDTAGTLLMRVASKGKLSSPWGIAMAPDGWGAFGGKLLIGNFAGGEINVFDPTIQNPDGTLLFLGFLHSSAGGPLVIPGLWSIHFAQGGANGKPDQLFFTGGPDHENGGIFGFLTVAGPPGHNKL